MNRYYDIIKQEAKTFTEQALPQPKLSFHFQSQGAPFINGLRNRILFLPISQNQG